MSQTLIATQLYNAMISHRAAPLVSPAQQGRKIMISQSESRLLTRPVVYSYMIINSIANVHTMVDVLYNSIQNAVTDYNGLTTEMVEAFVDLTNSKELKLTLDAVGLIYGLVAAPFWNSCESLEY